MSNQLVQIDELEKIINGYTPSDEVVQTLSNADIVFLTAPSGVGRSTVIRRLEESGQFFDLVTDTTRSPRINDGIEEQDGVEYYFKTEDEFIDGLKSAQYVDVAIIHNQQVSGLHVNELNRTKQQTKTAVIDVDPVGMEHYHSLKPEGHFIYLLPPSFDEWLRRITHRGDLDQDEIDRRLKSAETELQHAVENEFYTFVINDELETTAHEIAQIAEDDVPEDQQAVKDFIWQLINELKRKLYS